MRMRMADGFEHFQLTGFNDGDGLRAGDGIRRWRFGGIWARLTRIFRCAEANRAILPRGEGTALARL